MQYFWKIVVFTSLIAIKSVKNAVSKCVMFAMSLCNGGAILWTSESYIYYLSNNSSQRDRANQQRFKLSWNGLLTSLSNNVAPTYFKVAFTKKRLKLLINNVIIALLIILKCINLIRIDLFQKLLVLVQFIHRLQADFKLFNGTLT